MAWTADELIAINDLKVWAEEYEKYLRGSNATVTKHLKRMKFIGSFAAIENKLKREGKNSSPPDTRLSRNSEGF